MFFLKRYTLDMISLLFPELCNGCGTHLYHGEKQICSRCLFDLPYTDFHLYEDNPVAKLFWGRLPVLSATSMLYFKKETKVQNMMHQLKYNGRTDLGEELGRLLGVKLKNSTLFSSIDTIIPVPLHPKKLKLRGYNQSEHIAKGLARELSISVNTTALSREKATESQTKKARYKRFENMQEVFVVNKKYEIVNSHVLLIDDVITTGSTLEACGNALIAQGVKNLSIATIAFAQ